MNDSDGHWESDSVQAIPVSESMQFNYANIGDSRSARTGYRKSQKTGEIGKTESEWQQPHWKEIIEPSIADVVKRIVLRIVIHSMILRTSESLLNA